MRIAIAEDEKREAQLLLQHLERYARETSIPLQIDTFENGHSFLDQYTPAYDIVFMDIDMPHMNGIQVSKTLRKIDRVVTLIFVTNLKQFALQGYEVEAMDFLVKPVNYEKLRSVLGRAQEKLQTKPDHSEIIVKSNGTSHRIKTSDIYYIESLKHFVIYHTLKETYSFWGSLTDVERQLPPKIFCRCNHCYIVNLDHVTKIGNGFITVGVEDLRISRGRRQVLMQALARRMDSVWN